MKNRKLKRKQIKKKMPEDSLIIFVCEHGAAKSILAAAYFNKFAHERNLSLRAIARGTHPDEELSPITIAGLHEDGLTPIESVPQKLSLEDIEAAQQIISFCELPIEFRQKVKIEAWNDIPSVSENYEKARDLIVTKLKTMMEYQHEKEKRK
jgi:arsenate reductase